MRFLINMFNHSEIGQRSLEDVVGIFGHQLRALGHEAVWQVSNDVFLGPGEGINVIVEGFVPQHEAFFKAAYDRGCRFLMLATEEPTEKGFNHGTQKEMVWRMRDFAHAAKYFEGILYLVPGEFVHNWYNQHCPAAYVELGYAPSLVRPYQIEPDFDFGFYGSLTRRRLQILKRLANRIGTVKAVKVVSDFKTQEERDREMMRARVVVQVRKFEAMGLVSSSRCNTGLCLGRPVVAEPHLLSKPWDEVVQFSDTIEGFYSMAIMARANWKHLHREQMERFKTKFSPKVCVEEPLARIGFDYAKYDGSATRAA